jgi:uncharacterized protein/Tfp pilus assembly protein PilZ
MRLFVKKLLIMMLLSVISVFGTSFDCAKAKTNVEKMICSDAELSALDENLSKAFKEALKSTDDKEQLKKEQFAWMKERDKCKSNECLQEHYNNQIQTLSQSLIIKIDNLLEAQKIASDNYAKSKNVYPSIDMLKKAGIERIIHKKPENITKEQYIQLLNDYGYFLSLSEYSKYESENNFDIVKHHCEAKSILEKVQMLDPQRASVYLNLGDLYLKIYLSDTHLVEFPKYYRSGSCAVYSKDNNPKDLVYKSKQMYMQYAQLMTHTNRIDKIPEHIKLILNSNKVYMKRDWALKEKNIADEHICQAYVDTLNRLPQSARISECEHNISKVTNEFKMVSSDLLSQEMKEKSWCEAYLYKGRIFIDQEGFLFDGNSVFCNYTLLDFSKNTNNGDEK